MKNKGTLLFVYNADSGLPNKAIDFLHKAISPATYQCSLCSLTYGTFKIKEEWKTFIEGLPYKVIFFYKDEFRRKFPLEAEFPCIFLARDGSLQLLLNPGDMDNINLKDLKSMIQHRLSLL